MSAFVCSPEHFKALALFASRRVGGYGQGHVQVDPRYVEGLAVSEAAREALEAAQVAELAFLNQHELATLYADILYQENIRSCYARYPQDKTVNDLPGLIEKPDHLVVTGADCCGLARYTLPSVSILKMCDCLEYQSCETEDWDKSVAYSIVRAIRKAAVRALPGYDDAPWDYHIPAISKAA